jgi:Flp pilus assembly protein TadB
VIAIFGAVIGLMVAVGVWFTVAGLTPRPVVVRQVGRPVAWRPLLMRAGAAGGVFLAVWLATGWPAAGLVAAAGMWVAPLLVQAKRERSVVNERADGLAAWAEMLRDTISAHAGLHEAIALTAPVAPQSIRPQVQSLAARAERQPLGQALGRFATEVADPVADLIVAALTIAADRQAQRLPELLTQIAAAAREQSSMRLRVDTGRARTYASARALVVITFGLAVGLLLFSPSFMVPYDTATGQLVLMGIGGMFAGALAGLVSMSRPTLPPRLFVGDAEVGGMA